VKIRQSLAIFARWTMSLGLAGGLLLLAFRGVSLSQIVTALSQANPAGVVLAVGAVLATTAAKAARWQALVGARGQHLPLSRYFAVLIIGQTLNAILPGRTGELARAYLLGEPGVGRTYTLGTIVVEKSVDGLMLLLLLVVSLAFVPFPPWLSRSGLAASLILTILLLVLIVTAREDRRLRPRLVGAVARLPAANHLRLADRSQALLDSLGALRSNKGSWLVWGWSALIWALAVATNEGLFWAFGLHLPPIAAGFLLVVLHIGALLPTTPGQIGVFHYLCLLALGVFGVERDVALTASVVLHLVVFGPMLALGAYYLGREGEQLKRWWTQRENPGPMEQH